jgi:hypothetical protein
MNFSEESIFFLRNWGVIEKLLFAEKNFRKEFTEFLYSLEKTLQKRDWWDNSLIFNRYGTAQVFITKKTWGSGNDFSIWIGTEGFAPERLFGSDIPPQCYLWVRGDKKDKIMRDLTNIFSQEESFEEYLSTSGGYVLKKYIKKYTDEQFEEFIAGSTLDEIADFIEEVYLLIRNYEL